MENLEVFGAPPDESAGQAESTMPRDIDHRTATSSYFSYYSRFLVSAIKFILIVGVVGIIIGIPIIIYRDIENLPDDAPADQWQARLTGIWVFETFNFLEVTWLGIACWYLIGSALPYIFRLHRYVNPAYVRYWRIIRVMRKPLCYLGGTFMAFLGFAICITFNDYITLANGGQDVSQIDYVEFITDVLEQSSLWALFYFFEKIAILYTTIHYHFRSDLHRITASKDMQNALMALYEASVYLYPIGTPEFSSEDVMIGNATGAEHGEHRVRATRYLAKLGIDSYALTSFFGNFLSSDPKSHWLRPASNYAVVERAMANPKSAAALARRIWMSMVPVGRECLTADDIAEVLGPFRKEEAQRYFKALDQSNLGDIRLDEMEWIVADAGKTRNAIYRGMQNADHCINTLDWILLLFLGMVMLIFIMIKWIPALKDVQNSVQFFAVGLSFAVGRSVHHFLAGVVFILFDHPYDVGDRVELWSGQNKEALSLIVVRQSLLYTVFRRVDNWTELQAGNEFLQQCRIENVTRSGSNRQAVLLNVDIRTSFKDLTLLKAELEAFVKHADNRRDFLPNVALGIVGVHALDKMELRLVFTHRTNWSVEPLRAARSMKIMTALVAAVRKLRIQRPDGGPLGQPGKPVFNVMLGEKEADERMARLREEVTSARMDAGLGSQPPDAVVDVTGVVGTEVEEEKKVAREARLAEESKAMVALGKLPPVPHVGPPARDAVSSGADVHRLSTGMRALPHFRG
ncbi:Mechanosensitive ion channel protein 8 [Echria macrotheca]|uniref:Mechanosensitive ion channel protein 8 n=1 Tax=Echria macrotheca TaxID=438768 RepID=A0AAJ0BDX0_9PEZI|nr:Mechanosensitive ion channel protein 8 [Echria macrotheca]